MTQSILSKIHECEKSSSKRIGVPVAFIMVKMGGSQKKMKEAIKSLWCEDKITLNFPWIIDGKIQAEPSKLVYSKTTEENREAMDYWYFGDDDENSFLSLAVTSLRD